MPNQRSCPKCGSPLPDNSPKGGCPACLLRGALALSCYLAQEDETEKSGDRIGPYKLVEQIGEGGCGVVYLAEQEEPFRRRVALKVIKLGMDTKQVIARFEAERQALALMNHPNIAKVLDAGTTEAGRPFFVMELVEGSRLTDYCDKNELPMTQRLALFAQVCRAIQHAHQKGIIHRDIKPGNLLVTVADGVAVPKVIDFGIAKATQGRLTDQTFFTSFEQMLGTPAYMSPEQAEMTSLDIDTRSDIYSLGVLLYELLTGRTPFDGKELMAGGLDEMRRTIREKEPPRPSTRLSTMMATDLEIVAKRRETEPLKLIHQVRGDLDWIVTKAIEKDRARRYETANGLAKDVERHLNNEPVTAAAPSASYRMRKFARRHRVMFVATSLVVLAILAGIAGTIWGLVRAQRQAAIAQHTLYFLTNMFERIDPATAKLRQVTVREVLDDAARDVGTAFPNEPLTEMPIRRTIAEIYGKLGQQDLALPQAEAALRLAQIAHGTRDHPDVADALNNLAICRQELGRPADALPTFEAALAMRQRMFKGDHPDVAASQDDYASCLDDLGRSAEALPKYEAALAMQQRFFKGDHADVAISLNDVAYCLDELGRATEALTNYEAALNMFQRIHHGDHPEVAKALNNVAYCLQDLGRSTEALPKYQAALAMRQRIYQEDHPDVAQSLNNLGYCLEDLGWLDEALPNYEAGLAMKKRIFKRDHPDVARGLNNVGCCLRKLGRSSEALTNCQASLAMYQRIYQGDHPDVALGLNNAAYCLFGLGRLSEALPNYQSALAMYQRIHQGDHPDVALGLRNVAFCLQELGRPAEALPIFEAALAMRQRIYKGEARADTAKDLCNLGACLKTLDRPEESKRRYKEAIDMLLRLIAAQSDDISFQIQIANAHCGRGDLLTWMGDVDGARDDYRQGLQMVTSFPATNVTVQVDKVRFSLRLRLGLEQAEVTVTEVVPGSQAQRLGLRKGDVIIRYGGERITSTEQILKLTAHSQGTEIKLEALRDGKPVTFTVAQGNLGVVSEDRSISDTTAPEAK
jgi:serine/threonine protein kinase/tetratricopeptide (TPR) repeat protein